MLNSFGIPGIVITLLVLFGLIFWFRKTFRKNN
ncbi:putative membrane protein YqiK [Priestia megaterium]|jgi:hypothetical protein|nr:putative membrane protein YqiK [Priestia megaterium]CAH0325044.1 hypothetical protein SRABI82_05980 [Priestia megaterium]